MSLKKSEQLKQLKRQLDKVKARTESLRMETKKSQQELSASINHEKTLQKKINELEINNSEIVITDHALVRYMERVMGHEIDKIKEDMLNVGRKEIINGLGGTCQLPILSTGYFLVVKNNTIITVK